MVVDSFTDFFTQQFYLNPIISLTSFIVLMALSCAFSATIYDYKTIASHLKESAFLIKGLRIELNDFRTGKIGRITLEQANGNK